MKLIRPAAIALSFGLLMLVAVACTRAATSDTVSQPTPTQTPEPLAVEVPAPIESVGLEVSLVPPNPVPGAPSPAPFHQAGLVVVSGLPDGCHEFGSYGMDRDGDRIVLEVTNLKTTEPGIGCTEIYRTVETVDRQR